MLAVNLVAYLRIPFLRKVIVVACFAPRVLVIGASLARLIYLYPITPHDDPSFALWTPLLCTQLQVCLAISTACIPYIKPFFAVSEATPKEIEVGRRSSKSVKYIYAFGAQPAASMWKNKFWKLRCTKPSASDDLEYSCAGPSPRLPSPPPLSPLSPPRCPSPTMSLGQVANPAQQVRERGLRLQIPSTASCPTGGRSPQTASSHTQSPYAESSLYPQSLFSSQARSPGFLLRSHGRAQVHSSTLCGNGNEKANAPLKTQAPPHAAGYSLFPLPVPGRYAFVPRDVKPLVQKPLSSRHLHYRLQETNDTQPLYPERTSSLKRYYGQSRQAIKFAVGPNLTTTQPSTTILSKASRPAMTDDTSTSLATPSSPFCSRPTTTPPAVAVDEAPSPQQARNKRVLSPQNSARLTHINGVTPAKLRDSWRSTIYLVDAPDNAS